MPKIALRYFWIVFASVLLTSAVVGGGGYGWHRGEMRVAQKDSDTQISALGDELTVLKNRLEELQVEVDLNNYSNEEFGFSFKYPAELRPIEDLQEVDGEVSPVLSLYGEGTEPEIVIAKYDTGMQSIVKNYLIEGTEKMVMIDGFEGESFYIESQKDGSRNPQTMLIKENELYLFSGEGEVFDTVLKNFKFL